jgi:hypothetical protein
MSAMRLRIMERSFSLRLDQCGLCTRTTVTSGTYYTTPMPMGKTKPRAAACDVGHDDRVADGGESSAVYGNRRRIRGEP